MKRIFALAIVLFFSLFVFSVETGKVYTGLVEGKGKYGDPYIKVEGKKIYITNAKDLSKGTKVKVEVYRVSDYAAQAKLLKKIKTDAIKLSSDTSMVDKKKTIKLKNGDTYEVLFIGKRGNPAVKINGKITFLTNLSGENAPVGTKVKIKNVHQGKKVNFAEGIILSPDKEKTKSSTVENEKELKVGDVIEISISEHSKTEKPLGFYGKYMIFVEDGKFEKGKKIKVKIYKIEGTIGYGRIVQK